MKLVRHGVKTIIAGAFVLAFSTLPVNVFAETTDINDNVDASLSPYSPAPRGADGGQAYRPVAKVVPELAQIVFYYPQGNIPATINVDRELQSALLPGEFTVFCVDPGVHAIESYFNDRPRYQGKQNPSHQIRVHGSETYFLQVNPGSNGSTTALAERQTAEAELKSMRKQTRIINRASQVKPCEYVNGGGVVLIQESILFRFGKSHYDGIVPSSAAKLKNVIQFIKQGNSVSEIQLTGYTDAIGDSESNQRLSEARAKTVRDALIRAGIRADMIGNISGMGIAAGAEGCGVSRNQQDVGCNTNSRRVDIVVR
ncbi:OOP family OmpA-OmpF porin [Serratia fonticola]|jgi:outer membrane protein OmpA-like peptidoglycan-associated protein|uniref:OOP family OmpA-OmpF porin n=1 Tax=Serratia fonticola TaxID=47917 RepID=A0A542BUM7_SERFO|nr:OmpA family protein [Serratia fonticola]TQI82255.1 OOP family OmpA-OmpF porin [Serratia fonticola]TQI95725.1 OOP family OmpA-OmpF porin [Serratia fonticola]TVZ70220.1 OOP family OmpA-OmpF porin [Serratia fonticola]